MTKNTETVNKWMSNISEKQKKIKKWLQNISNEYITKFKKELWSKENKELKDFLEEKIFQSFDVYKTTTTQKDKSKIIAKIMVEFKNYTKVDDKKFNHTVAKSITMVFDKLIENLSSDQITEMNYQVIRINMIQKLTESLHANFIKFEKRDEFNLVIEKMMSSIEWVWYSWINLSMKDFLNATLDMIEYSVKATYYEPDVSDESMSDIFLWTCEKFLTTIPAELMLYSFQSRLKWKVIDDAEFDKLILKFTKNNEE